MSHPGAIRASSSATMVPTRDNTAKSSAPQPSRLPFRPIRCAAPGSVIINARNNKTEVGIDLEPGCDYVVIKGFNVVGTGGIATYGIKATGDNDQAINNIVHDISNATAGIHFNGGNNGLIQGNDVYNIGGTDTRGHAIYVANNDGTRVIGNYMHDCETIGIHINGDPNLVSHLLIDSNIIANNGDNAINADGLQNSVIQNNLIYGYSRTGIVLYQSDASGPGKNNVIVNNTIVSTLSGTGAAFRANNGSTPNIVYNNILLGGGNEVFGFSSDSLTQTIGYNVLPQNPQLVDEDSGDTSNLPASMSQNSIVATPGQLFVNAGASDYHLSSTSPAIDAGTATNAPADDNEGLPRPMGSRYDIGAYEASGAQLRRRLGHRPRRRALPRRPLGLPRQAPRRLGLRRQHRPLPRRPLRDRRPRPRRVQRRLGPRRPLRRNSDTNANSNSASFGDGQALSGEWSLNNHLHRQE